MPRDGVVVIASTNFPDHVDSALKRPDGVIVIPRPDEMALAGIVAHHINVDADARDQGFGLKGDKGLRSPTYAPKPGLPEADLSPHGQTSGRRPGLAERRTASERSDSL